MRSAECGMQSEKLNKGNAGDLTQRPGGQAGGEETAKTADGGRRRGFGIRGTGKSIADCGLRSADCGLRSADCGLRSERQEAKDPRRPPASAQNTSARRLPQFTRPP